MHRNDWNILRGMIQPPEAMTGLPINRNVGAASATHSKHRVKGEISRSKLASGE
jgi:hypothetical protein